MRPEMMIHEHDPAIRFHNAPNAMFAASPKRRSAVSPSFRRAILSIAGDASIPNNVQPVFLYKVNCVPVPHPTSRILYESFFMAIPFLSGAREHRCPADDHAPPNVVASSKNTETVSLLPGMSKTAHRPAILTNM